MKKRGKIYILESSNGSEERVSAKHRPCLRSSLWHQHHNQGWLLGHSHVLHPGAVLSASDPHCSTTTVNSGGCWATRSHVLHRGPVLSASDCHWSTNRTTTGRCQATRSHVLHLEVLCHLLQTLTAAPAPVVAIMTQRHECCILMMCSCQCGQHPFLESKRYCINEVFQ